VAVKAAGTLLFTTTACELDANPLFVGPTTTDEAPATTDEAPTTTDEAPATTDEAPATTDEARTDEAPATTDEAATTTDELRTTDEGDGVNVTDGVGNGHMSYRTTLLFWSPTIK